MSAPAAAPAQRFARLERTAPGVARLVLDRPPVNVLTIGMMEEIAALLDDVAADRTAKVLVLSGAGRAFCAGVDVADHGPDRVHAMLASFHAVITRLRRLDCVVVAAVGGAALGGGCELLYACDVVLARADARIGQPEIGLGVFPPVALALLPRLVGRQRALDIVLSGTTMDGAAAHEAGIVTRVAPADDFPALVEGYVARLASLSGPVLRLTKRTLLETQRLAPEAALRHVDAAYAGELLRLEDAREGIAAFVEKRTPEWREA